MMKIKERIIVEGRDDTAAIKKSVDAITIETHGYGINDYTWELISKAYETKGIIVFTDPDHAGEQIRRRILSRFPDAREAFLDRTDAEKDGDIGIENASPESIRQALARARCSSDTDEELFPMDDLFMIGLVGQAESAAKRKALGKALGIGYANGRGFLQRLNKFGITREAFVRALEEI